MLEDDDDEARVLSLTETGGWRCRSCGDVDGLPPLPALLTLLVSPACLLCILCCKGVDFIVRPLLLVSPKPVKAPELVDRATEVFVTDTGVPESVLTGRLAEGSVLALSV